MGIFSKNEGEERLLIEDPGKDQIEAALILNHPDQSGLDETRDLLFISSDRLRFRSFSEVIREVIEANGYVANLENTLATLDSLKFAVRARAQFDTDQDTPKQISQFFDCISFHMPRKTRQGELLKAFYTEVNGYEQEVQRLALAKKGEQSPKDPAEKTIERLRKHVDRLSSENEQLKLAQQQLIDSVKELERSRASTSKALHEQNLIPPGIRVAKVKEVSAQDNKVLLRYGRTNQQMPLGLMDGIPRPGDECLLWYPEDAKYPRTLLFGRAFESFIYRPAQVLAISDQAIKVRDVSRNIWSARMESRGEQKLARHDWVMIKEAQGYPVAIQPCPPVLHSDTTLAVQTAICMHQIHEVEIYLEHSHAPRSYSSKERIA